MLRVFQSLCVPVWLLLPLAASGTEVSAEAALDYREAMQCAANGDNGCALVGLNRSAEAGFLPAYYALGWVYRQGRGVPADPEKAFKWFERAAEAGLPEAQHMLGVLYTQGEGTPVNKQLGLQWIQRAAAQAYPPARAVLEKLGVPHLEDE
jgi:TPR repeat protein